MRGTWRVFLLMAVLATLAAIPLFAVNRWVCEVYASDDNHVCTFCDIYRGNERIGSYNSCEG